MKDNTDKQLDNLVGKIIKDASLESPSFDFTNSVMSQINSLNTSKSLVYKPLISKTVWGFISIGFLLVVLYAIFGTTTENSSLLTHFDFSIFDLKWKSVFSGFAFSKTAMYAIVFFGLMFCLQIPFLKHHFNQRLQD
jgi:hypothetical protein